MPFREFAKNRRDVVRVVATVYEGYELLDVRIYAKNPSGEVGPTRKGISLNIDIVPDLIDALLWALGQPCAPDGAAAERHLSGADAEHLATITWDALQQHGSAVHWDTIERMIAPMDRGLTKWDLHYVLVTRVDLFRRVDSGCFRALPRVDSTTR